MLCQLAKFLYQTRLQVISMSVYRFALYLWIHKLLAKTQFVADRSASTAGLHFPRGLGNSATATDQSYIRCALRFNQQFIAQSERVSDPFTRHDRCTSLLQLILLNTWTLFLSSNSTACISRIRDIRSSGSCRQTALHFVAQQQAAAAIILVGQRF